MSCPGVVGHLTVSLVLNMGPGLLQVRRTQEVAQSGKERPGLIGEQSGLSPQLSHVKSYRNHTRTQTLHDPQCMDTETYTEMCTHTYCPVWVGSLGPGQ